MGEVHFVGEVSDEELDYVIEMGLLTLLVRGELKTQFVEDTKEELIFNTEGPDHGDTIQ